jgi:hypothetical protein
VTAGFSAVAQEGEPQQRSDRQGRNKTEHDQHESLEWQGAAGKTQRRSAHLRREGHRIGAHQGDHYTSH